MQKTQYYHYIYRQEKLRQCDLEQRNRYKSLGDCGWFVNC